MSKLKVRRPSPALAISLIALFVALGGSAFAALGANTVGTKQLKPNSVNANIIAKKGVKSKNLAKRAVGGNKIKPGAVGDTQLSDPSFWAYVSGGATPTVARGNGATTVANIAVGHFAVTFEEPVNRCSYQATPRDQGNGREIAAEIAPNSDNVVQVRVRNSNAVPVNTGAAFSLLVAC